MLLQLLLQVTSHESAHRADVAVGASTVFCILLASTLINRIIDVAQLASQCVVPCYRRGLTLWHISQSSKFESARQHCSRFIRLLSALNTDASQLGKAFRRL